MTQIALDRERSVLPPGQSTNSSKSLIFFCLYEFEQDLGFKEQTAQGLPLALLQKHSGGWRKSWQAR